MSYEMIMMLYRRSMEKANACIEGTKEFYAHIKNLREYSAMLKEMDKKRWS